jgi:hypothetical protein
MNKKTKKVTLHSLGNTVGNLATTVGKLFATVGNLSNKVDKLATTVEVGFKRAEGRMDKGFKEAQEDNESFVRMVANGFKHTDKAISGLKNNIVILEQGQVKLEQAQTRLEQGQENIQLRLDYLAPQFEVKELTRRVKRLEDKVGIKR